MNKKQMFESLYNKHHFQYNYNAIIIQLLFINAWPGNKKNESVLGLHNILPVIHFGIVSYLL